jgi:translation initiation factor IF-2
LKVILLLVSDLKTLFQVTESDLALAQRFNAIIYAFNTTIPPALLKAADTAKVPVRPYNVIYHLIDDLKQEISLRLPPANVEDVLGRANVLQEFLINVGKKKEQAPVAGCRVVAGRIPRGGAVRVMRNNVVLYEGELASLKHLKVNRKFKREMKRVALSPVFRIQFHIKAPWLLWLLFVESSSTPIWILVRTTGESSSQAH